MKKSKKVPRDFQKNHYSEAFLLICAGPKAKKEERRLLMSDHGKVVRGQQTLPVSAPLLKGLGINEVVRACAQDLIMPHAQPPKEVSELRGH